MIWQHFKTIVWLRWRMSANQWKKGGALNAVLGVLLLILCLLGAVTSFFVALLVGIFAMPEIPPGELLLVWDVIIVAFLFCWVMGLITDLQRSDTLSPEKLLHLPVSLSGTFLLNYLGSWISLSLLVFLPTAAGLGLGLVIVKGPAMLILFPLLVSFVLMVTAITNQLRGWLHILMVNKRRRRTIIALVTAAFILLIQVPNLVNIGFQRSHRENGSSLEQRVAQQLKSELELGTLDSGDYRQREAELRKELAEKKAEEDQEALQRVVATADVINIAVPPGWLPYGARAAAAGQVLPGVWGTLGALAIAVLSLRRSYRRTVLFYTRGFQVGPRKRTAVVKAKAPAACFLERRFALLSDQATAVMLASMRSLMRAPEGKILVLSPIFLLGFFGVMIFWGRDRQVPELARPFLGMGVVSMTLLCYTQVLFNLFGFDRAGFRAIVLSPSPRQDVLLGKNLAIAPLALGVSALALASLQIFRGMGVMSFLATLIQLPAAYLVFCLLGNVISIVAPSATASGTLKPARAKWLTILIHTAAALLSPVAVLPACIAQGVELLAHDRGWLPHVPIYLLLSLLQFGVVVWLYRWLLPMQGRLLQRREKSVLETVTAKID